MANLILIHEIIVWAYTHILHAVVAILIASCLDVIVGTPSDPQRVKYNEKIKWAWKLSFPRGFGGIGSMNFARN